MKYKLRSTLKFISEPMLISGFIILLWLGKLLGSGQTKRYKGILYILGHSFYSLNLFQNIKMLCEHKIKSSFSTVIFKNEAIRAIKFTFK